MLAPAFFARSCRLAVMIVIALIASLTIPALAAADTGDPPPALGLDSIGSSSTISLAGQQGQFSLSIPVPANLTPETLRGTTYVPGFVTGGQIEVFQGQRLISRTAISRAANATIELPLRGVVVSENAVDLTLRAYLNTDGICRFDPDTGFRITNTTVSFTGREEVPSTVADFLPPILRQLTLIIPSDVNAAEGAAAVELAGAVTSHYGTATVPIRTIALPRENLVPTTAPGPLQRQIVIDSSAASGLTLRDGVDGSKYLVIGGPSDRLLAQARLLTTDLASIALSSSAVAGPIFDTPQLARDVATLADLGIGDQQATSWGWPSVSFGIDQTRLGRAAKNVRVQLTGSYAPAGGDGAVIAVRVGDRVIATLPAESSGTFDRWVDIPNDVLRRYTEVTLTLERGGVQDGCGTGTRSTIALASSGEISSEVADPPQPAGFDSVPQALMPTTQLAWTVGDVADVTRGVSIVAGLSHLSSVPLGINVVSIQTAATSTRPAILIAADGSGLPTNISLPVTTDGDTVTVRSEAGGSARLTLTPSMTYGALQVTQSGGRTLVVANSTDDAAELDRLLSWLDEDDRWTAINGDAVVAATGQPPVYVDAAAATPAAAAPAGLSTAARWGILVGVLVGSVAIAAGVLFGLRWARRRRADKQGPAPE